jgi:hypothetical protein
VFFHEKIGLFPHACQFGLFGLLDGIGLAIDFGDGFEDGREVAGSKVLNFMELVHAFEIFLGFLLGLGSFGASKFMRSPVFLLAVSSAVVD